MREVAREERVKHVPRAEHIKKRLRWNVPNRAHANARADTGPPLADECVRVVNNT